MARVRTKELDSLFVLRHAQRADRLAATVSSLEFDYQHSLQVHETFNPPLATFASTQNRCNNGYTQARQLGAKVLNYVSRHVEAPVVVLRLHTSPYLRCVETAKHMVDYIVQHHDSQTRQIRIVVAVDQVLSEWLNAELDINDYPPNDNGATLLATAVQYLTSNIPLHRNSAVPVTLSLGDSYKHGNPGPFAESLRHQFSRLSDGVVSIVKEAQNSLSPGPDTKDIVLLMTHGACVRSIVSKLAGRSLMVEVPLASATLAKPQGSDGRHCYYWQVEETDIELRRSIESLKPVDLYSSRDAFQDVQTTFGSSLSSQLDFNTHVPASKTENFNRMRSHSLLNPARASSHDSDSDSDSDDEGISFNVNPSRRASSAHPDNPRRFRSSSLFGPTLNNPFFEDSRTRGSASRQNSFERVKASLRQDEEYISPKMKSSTNLAANRYNFSPALTNNNTPRITPTTSSTNLKMYQNIDEGDGTHGEIVPELAELSSNNSSTASLPEAKHELPQSPVETFTTTTVPTPIPTKQHTASESSLSTIQPSKTSTSLFDKSLIEESLNEIHQEKSPSPMKTDWMNFKSSTNQQSIPPNTENKFKIDLYGKKNRTYKLNLYDDDEDDGQSGGWFLGSNKF